MIKTSINPFEILFIVLNVTLIIKGNDVVNQDIEKMIEMAGCPFVSIHQKLVRNVCLLPAYQINEAPMGLNNHTYVKIDLHRVSILEIDEQKNKLSLHISQALQWPEPRIRANFSTVLNDRPSIKLSPEDFLKIWHPDLDIDTNNFAPIMISRQLGAICWSLKHVVVVGLILFEGPSVPVSIIFVVLFRPHNLIMISMHCSITLL